MRRVLFVVTAIICILLQMSLLPALRPLGVVPDLALVLVALVGLEGTASAALMVAVAGGLALDLASGAYFGLWTGILVLVALTMGLLHRAGIELGGGIVAIVMVAVGTVLMTLVIWLGLIDTVSHWPVGWLLVRLGTELGLNLALTVALRPLVRWLLRGSHMNVVMG
jgi:hypothetical protein